MRVKDLTGQRFGRLVVIRFNRISTYGSALWLCRCDCGTTIVADGGNLRSENTRSCGCLQRESTARMGKANRTHGMKHTRIYTIWRRMNDRCYYPGATGFDRYGGRGITVCKRWRAPHGFERFLNDMGQPPSPKHSIDRIDNDGPYKLSNVRWATRKEQALNRRPRRSHSTRPA